MDELHKNQSRSVESAVVGVGFKYGGKLLAAYLPQIRIILGLFFVRLGMKKTITFKFPYMVFASNWASKFGLRSDTISYPGGVDRHRAIGIPENDNSSVVGIMTFK